MTEQPLVVDLFAGPGGWDEGARMAGLGMDVVGVELDDDACATARAAGHVRERADVSAHPFPRFLRIDGLLASPPCPPFSTAGNGKGKLDRPRLDDHVEGVRRIGGWVDYSKAGWHDRRSPLVLEPLRWALLGKPRWMAWEQVPAVLPFWELCAEVLRDHGHSVATGKLSAEQYGVPQTRKRAFLVARNDGIATLPEPTHQAYRKGKPVDMTSPLPRWVSMAEALGWGMDERPSLTVTGGGYGDRGRRAFRQRSPHLNATRVRGGEVA